ncbi:acyltransferase [Pseudomonas sp. CCNWLW56]|uniref:acyltransferase family protein n=1 Tax=unclassified Pseudomonas TaxID=196821 RepID=UPI00307814F7
MSAITPHQARQLDSVRGLSSLIVLVGHANQTFITPIENEHSVVVGFFTQFAVMVFFALSGFLVGTSIFRNIAKNQRFLISKYAYDRALRIYPPLIAATFLMISIWQIAPYILPSGTYLFSETSNKLVRTGIFTNANEIFGSLLFLNGFKTTTPGPNGPLWSLSYEVWYYVFAGLLFTLPRRKLLAITLLIMAIYITRKNQQFIMLSTVWAAGLVLAKLHQSARLPSVKTMRTAAKLLAAATILTIVCVLKLNPGHSAWLNPWNYFMVISGTWFTTILAMVLQSAISLPTHFHKSAAYSYTLYIIHFPIMLLIFGAFQTCILDSLEKSILFAIIAVLFCTAIAATLAKYVENRKFLETHIKALSLQLTNK